LCTQQGRKWDQSGIKHIGREDGRANVVKGKREGDDKPVQDK
jgi:hypothetical protein